MDSQFLMQSLSEMNASIRALQGDVTEIKESLAEKKGERKAALWLFGTASGFAGAILSIVFHKFVP